MADGKLMLILFKKLFFVVRYIANKKLKVSMLTSKTSTLNTNYWHYSNKIVILARVSHSMHPAFKSIKNSIAKKSKLEILSISTRLKIPIASQNLKFNTSTWSVNLRALKEK